MFVRLIILIAIMYVCQCRRHHRHDTSIEEKFEDIYEDTIYMDKRFNIMRKYENNVAFERVEKNWYSRKILIRGFNENKISIKIKHRVMYTKVENIYTGRESLEDIKVLPVNLNTKKAFYEVMESKLYIYIPFLEQCEDTCNIEINENLITVPEDNFMSHVVDSDSDSSNQNNLYVAGNANNAISGNKIDNSLSCAIMVKSNPTVKINENILREIFGELLNTSNDKRWNY